MKSVLLLKVTGIMLSLHPNYIFLAGAETVLPVAKTPLLVGGVRRITVKGVCLPPLPRGMHMEPGYPYISPSMSPPLSLVLASKPGVGREIGGGVGVLQSWNSPKTSLY